MGLSDFYTITKMKKQTYCNINQIKFRRTWKIKPITRIKTSKKVYDRNRDKELLHKELK